MNIVETAMQRIKKDEGFYDVVPGPPIGWGKDPELFPLTEDQADLILLLDIEKIVEYFRAEIDEVWQQLSDEDRSDMIRYAYQNGLRAGKAFIQVEF